MKLINWGVMIAIGFALFACQEQNYVPKPVGYARIDFEPHQFIKYNQDCPFTFEYGALSRVKPVLGKNNSKCWFNLEYPKQKAKVHFSYLPIGDLKIESLTKDARKLALEHLSKADDFEENVVIDTAQNVYGIIYDFKGSTASNMQFYLTDSVNHFVRGALYFEVTPKADSLAPAEKFIEEELKHLINSFTWK
ncbi:MAG: gliding motility lipoprotein GldD [Salibacteraceae bacterium]